MLHQLKWIHWVLLSVLCGRNNEPTDSFHQQEFDHMGTKISYASIEFGARMCNNIQVNYGMWLLIIG